MVVQQTETDSHKRRFDLWVKPVTIHRSGQSRGGSSLGRRDHIKKPEPDPDLVLILRSSPESSSPPHKLWKGVPLCSCYTAVVETALRAPC